MKSHCALVNGDVGERGQRADSVSVYVQRIAAAVGRCFYNFQMDEHPHYSQVKDLLLKCILHSYKTTPLRYDVISSIQSIYLTEILQ